MIIIFFPNIKFINFAWYESKSVQFGQSAQLGGGLIAGVEIHVCLNLGKGCWRVKNKKFATFLAMKISPLSQLGGEIWGFPFLTSKMCCSSRISPPNWAKKLKLGTYI